MPFTPFHFGPGLLIGLLTLRYLDFPTFLLGSVVVDWRAALVYLGSWPGPRHGWMHSYLGGVAFGMAMAGVIVRLRPRIDETLRELHIEQPVSSGRIVAGAVVAIVVHVTIDALHHPLMEPFWPLGSGNPLFGYATTFELRAVTAFCLFFGLQLYLIHVLGVIDLAAPVGPAD